MNERVATAVARPITRPGPEDVRTVRQWGRAGVSVFPGPEQAEKVGVPVSIEHRNVTGPIASLPLNVNVGVASLVAPDGPLSMRTEGGVASTSKLRVAVAELPAASVACTRKV